MFIRKYWKPTLTVFIVALVGVGLYSLQTRPPKPPILIVTPVEFEKLPAKAQPAKAPVVEQTPQGHVHEDGTFHAEPRETPQLSTDARDTPEPVASPAPMETLTYHTELLDRHPVEALRQQARELGHWSADHIPPFPPDDDEAAEFARNTYLCLYYRKTGQTDHPDYLRAFKAEQKFYHELRDRYERGWGSGDPSWTPWVAARHHDLMKITWPVTTTFHPGGARLPTTFTEGINPESARPLLPFELEMSGMLGTQ